MDSTEIHNVLTAKAKLDAKIRRLTDAFDERYPSLSEILELFESQIDKEFRVYNLHGEVTVLENGRHFVFIHNGGKWGDDDCDFDLIVEDGKLVRAEDMLRGRKFEIKELNND